MVFPTLARFSSTLILLSALWYSPGTLAQTAPPECGRGVIPTVTRTLPVDAEDFPRLPRQSATSEGFVPSGWVIEKELHGDLNGDTVPDLVLVLRKANARNIAGLEEGDCIVPIDTNPRILVIAFRARTAESYTLVVENHGLIPREGLPVPDTSLVNAWDPLVSVTLVRGSLLIALAHGAERDWNRSSEIYTFRYGNGCFQEIGYDSIEVDTKVDSTAISANFLTGKQKELVNTAARSTTRWTTLPKRRLVCLDDIGYAR